MRKEVRTRRSWCATSSTGEEPCSFCNALSGAGFTIQPRSANAASKKLLRGSCDSIDTEQRASTHPSGLLHRYFDRGVGPAAFRKGMA